MSLIDKILIALGFKKKPEPVVDTWTTTPPLPGAASAPAAPSAEAIAAVANAAEEAKTTGGNIGWPFPGDKPAEPTPVAAMTPAPKKKRGRPAKAK